MKIKEELKTWALNNRITHTALNSLMTLLRDHIPTLPKDSRTLLKTPQHVNIITMGTGEYWYNGLRNCVINTFADLTESIVVSLTFNIHPGPGSELGVLNKISKSPFF